MNKINNKKNPRCPHCKGLFSVGGTFRKRIPLGFGFRAGADGFVIDVIEVRGYTGFCLDCGKDGEVVFSRHKKAIKSRSINRKIAALSK